MATVENSKRTYRDAPLERHSNPVKLNLKQSGEVNSGNIKQIRLEDFEIESKECPVVTVARKVALAVKKIFMIIGEIIYNIFSLAFEKIKGLFVKNKQEEPASYLFAQQYNNACHEAPIYNYHVLQNLKGSENAIDLKEYNDFDGSPLTRRQWYGKNYEWLKDNLAVIGDISDKEKYPNLTKYLEKGLNSPVFPICSYSNGKAPFLSFMRKFSEGAFFYINPDQLEELDLKIGPFSIDGLDPRDDAYLSVPIIEDKEGVKIFNTQTNEYEFIEGKPWISIAEYSCEDFKKSRKISFNYDLIAQNPDLLKSYPIPKEDAIVLFDDKDPSEFAGFKNMAFIENKTQLINLNDQDYFMYLKAVYRLMIFSLGVDHNNNDITPEHEDYAAYIELHEVLKKHPKDLWNRQYFNKEIFGNYQVTKVLKENQTLAKLGAQLADKIQFEAVKEYKEIKEKVGDENLDDMERMMGSEEQIISHVTTRNIRSLMYGAMNPDSLVASLEMGDTLSSLLPSHAIYEGMKDQANLKHEIEIDGKFYRISFMDYWKLVVAELKKLGCKDLIMFDDHGWVLSLDENVIKMQNTKSKFYDKETAEDAQIGIIESWHGKHFDIWYKNAQIKQTVNIKA